MPLLLNVIREVSLIKLNASLLSTLLFIAYINLSNISSVFKALKVLYT
jgi:hypothetical protein